MTKVYSVDLWNNDLAQKGLDPRSTVTLSLEQIKLLDTSIFTFEMITNHEDVYFEASDISCDSIALVAKYLIQPYENGRMQHPFSAYVTALNNDNTSLYVLDEDQIEQEIEYDATDSDFDIRTVVDWVNHRLVDYSEGTTDMLLDAFSEKLINKVVEKIRLTSGDEIAHFVEMNMYADKLANKFDHDLEYTELESSHPKNGRIACLFKLNDTPHDNLIKTCIKEF